MKKYNFTKLTGNLLMLSGILLLIFIYAPYLALYLPTPQAQITDSTFSIHIPKINAYAPVIPNIDPWQKELYEEPLKKGVAQATGFSEVGQPGTVFLFAHSSLPPWEMTRANTGFLRLGELKTGDQITINKEGQKYTYEVFDKKEVWPNQVKELIENKEISQLVLQTCSPVGTDFKRLLVYAKQL